VSTAFVGGDRAGIILEDELTALGAFTTITKPARARQNSGAAIHTSALRAASKRFR